MEQAADFQENGSLRYHSPANSRRVRIHIGAQYGVNPRLVATLLPEPFKQVRIKPHGHDCLPAWPYDPGILPELFIGGEHVGVRFDALAYSSVAHAAKSVPVRASPALRIRRFASRRAFRAAPPAMPR